MSKKVVVLGARGLAGSAIRKRVWDSGVQQVLCPRSFELDLREQADVREYFDKHKPDQVYLAAALVGGILANKTRKAEFLYDNLMMQSNVIDAAYCAGVKKLLFLGTSCIYPAGLQHPIKEEELLTGPLEPTNDAYSIAKIAGIKLCDFYREQYGFDAISVMPPNLYGPGDNFDKDSGHVLASLMRKFDEAKLMGDKQVVCWGDGSPRREFLHSDDLAGACVYLMENYSESGHLNLGSGQEVTIKELAETIADVVGFEGEIVWDTNMPNGNPRKLLDSSKAFDMGWKPLVELRDGIKTTYQYYIENVRLETNGRHSNSSRQNETSMVYSQ